MLIYHSKNFINRNIMKWNETQQIYLLKRLLQFYKKTKHLQTNKINGNY